MSIPREYQESCVNELKKVRAEGSKKALIVMASGLGKTLMVCFDIKEFLKTKPEGRVLMLCHSIDVLAQAKEVFKGEFQDEYSYGMYYGLDKVGHRVDFLFASLQSVFSHLEDFAREEFDYIVVDEAHHAPANTYAKTIQHFNPQFLLGMTATPDRADNAELAPIFGETVYEYDLVRAVNDGWLARIDYRLELDELVSLDALLDSTEQLSLKRLNRELFLPKRDEEIVRLIRERSAEKTDPTTVIFCQTIAHAEHFAELMDATVIHSSLPTEEREARLERFRKGEIKTVCAVDILNEGIDVPRTDVIVFLRVTQSRVVFLQQLGRGLRQTPDKDEVLVLDFVGTAERIDQIFELKRSFMQATEVSNSGENPEVENDACDAEAKPKQERFVLNIDTPEFRERAVDIMSLIERAKDCKTYFTDEELIADFRKECENLGHFPSQEEFFYHPGVVYRKRFGSLRKASELAGCMDYWSNYAQRSKNFPEDEALDLLAEMFNKLERVPTKHEVDGASGMPTTQYYTMHFGGLNKALAIRGIFPSNSQKRGVKLWERDNIREALRKLYAELGRPIKKEDVDACPYTPNMVSVNRVFGALSAALLYSGVPVHQIRIPKSKIALAVFDELGVPTDFFELAEFVKKNHDNPESVAHLIDLEKITRRLGEREREKKPIVPKVKPTRNEMLEAIRNKAQQIGRAPTRRDMDKDPNTPSGYMIKKEFGTYNDAILEAGLSPNPGGWASYNQKTKEP